MTTKIAISVHEFVECGFYQRRHGVGRRAGSVSEAFSSLASWIADPGRSLVDTKTFEPREKDSVLSAYCISCSQHSNDFVVMLWNQTHTQEEGVGCIQANVAPARATVVDIAAPADTIPGYPTYFWVIPEANVYCTITLEGRVSGNQAFNRYMGGFLKQCPRHTVYQEVEPGNVERVGYGLDNRVAVRGLLPKFRTQLLSTHGELDAIRARLPEVTKLYRRKTLRFVDRQHRGVMETLYSYVCRGVMQRIPEVYEIEFGVDGPVTPDDFQDIVAIYEQEDGEWDDVGFRFRGSPDTKWLGHGGFRIKNSIELPLGRNNLPAPAEMYQQLRRFRDGIVGRVQANR